MTDLLTGINGYIWSLFGKIIRHERSQFTLMLRYHCFCRVPRLLLQPAPELTDQQGFNLHSWFSLGGFVCLLFHFLLIWRLLHWSVAAWRNISFNWKQALGGGNNSLNLNTFGSVPMKDARTLCSSLWRRHADSSANNPARGEVQALRHANILLVTASETWSQWCWWLGEGFLKTYWLQSLVESRKWARKKKTPWTATASIKSLRTAGGFQSSGENIALICNSDVLFFILVPKFVTARNWTENLERNY